MATIETRLPISNTNIPLQPLDEKAQQAVLTRAAKLDVVTGIRSIPRKIRRRTPTVTTSLLDDIGITPGERFTLLALSGCLGVEGLLASETRAEIELTDLCNITRISRVTTIKHIESLARAGWIHVYSFGPEKLAYAFAQVVTLHAEWKRLRQRPASPALVETPAEIQFLQETIEKQLSDNSSNPVVFLHPFTRVGAQKLSKELGTKVLDLLRAAVAQVEAGGDAEEALRGALAAGAALVGEVPPPRQPGTLAIAPAQKEASRAEYLACRKIRDQLLILATRLGDQRLVDEVLAFARSDQGSSLVDLQKKLRELQKMPR